MTAMTVESVSPLKRRRQVFGLRHARGTKSQLTPRGKSNYKTQYHKCACWIQSKSEAAAIR